MADIIDMKKRYPLSNVYVCILPRTFFPVEYSLVCLWWVTLMSMPLFCHIFLVSANSAKKLLLRIIGTFERVFECLFILEQILRMLAYGMTRWSRTRYFHRCFLSMD